MAEHAAKDVPSFGQICGHDALLWQRPSGVDNSYLDGYLGDMSAYSVAEAKNNLPKLLDRALAGEDVTITRRGKPVAKLSPLGGEARGGSIDMEWLERVRVKPADPNFDVLELIGRMRDEDPY